uniref:Helitron_like_N domain-containing protein n=1 Tax=Panagrellus redivivus TaxID=6233 RepID=A0A7E4UMW1_PANRE
MFVRYIVLALMPPNRATFVKKAPQEDAAALPPAPDPPTPAVPEPLLASTTSLPSSEAASSSQKMAFLRNIGTQKRQREKENKVDRGHKLTAAKKRKSEEAEKRRAEIEKHESEERRKQEELAQCEAEKEAYEKKSIVQNRSDSMPPAPKTKPTPPDRTIHDVSQMSERTKQRRRAAIRKEAEKIFPDGFEVKKSRRKQPAISAEDCVRLLATTNVTVSFLRILRRYGIVPSITKIYEVKHALLHSMPSIDMFTIGPRDSEVTVTLISLHEVLKYALSKPQFVAALPPGPIKVTLAADAGGSGVAHSTKLCCYFNDIENPISVNNLIVLACYPATDSRVYLKDLFAAYIDEFKKLENGIDTAEGHRELELFIVLDLKCNSTVIGHQGSSATFFCQFCFSTDDESQHGVCCRSRTLEDQWRLGLDIENKGGTSRAAKRAHLSVFGPPLIPPSIVVVPPVMHVFGGVLNVILKRVVEAAETDPIFDEMLGRLTKECGVEIQYPSHEYLAKDATKLTHYIIDGDHFWVPLYDLLFEACELLRFCKARYYEDNEIEEFAQQVKVLFVKIRENELKIIPKAHIFEHHIVPFFRTYKSWSIFSEQSVECLHKVYNVVAAKRRGKSKKTVERAQSTFFTNNLLRLRPSG